MKLFPQRQKSTLYYDTKVKQILRLNGEDIKRSSDFCYLGSIVAEDGGTSKGSKCKNTQGEEIILQIKKCVAIQITTKRH